MTDNHSDPLQQLWQQYDIPQADITQLNQEWRSMRRKQHLFLLLDLLALLAVVALALYFYPQLHWYSRLWFAVVLVLAALFTGYIGWLRRHSLNWRIADQATDNHLQQLTRQVKSNVIIARLTKYSLLALPLLYLALYVGLYFLDPASGAGSIRRGMIAMLVLAILLPLMWYWASKRQSRFQAQLANLQQIIQGQ